MFIAAVPSVHLDHSLYSPAYPEHQWKADNARTPA